MNSRIQQILDQIAALEAELQVAVEHQEARLRYSIEGRRVTFEQVIKEMHLKVKTGVFRWLSSARPQNFLTAPIIYGMIFPLTLLDLSVTLYQWICFPIYGIGRVKRADYFVMDHQHLAYLNVIEKMDCMYCSYTVGLFAYATEITARTEQYFCPIKHARKVRGAHQRYARFLNYGEADNLQEKIREFRRILAEESESDKNT